MILNGYRCLASLSQSIVVSISLAGNGTPDRAIADVLRYFRIVKLVEKPHKIRAAGF
jgi:hypothetical protein